MINESNWHPSTMKKSLPKFLSLSTKPNKNNFKNKISNHSIKSIIESKAFSRTPTNVPNNCNSKSNTLCKFTMNISYMVMLISTTIRISFSKKMLKKINLKAPKTKSNEKEVDQERTLFL